MVNKDLLHNMINKLKEDDLEENEELSKEDIEDIRVAEIEYENGKSVLFEDVNWD